MKTFSAKPTEVERQWHVIDAAGKVLGKVAVEAARYLRGKHKPIFTTHIDTGDFVIVINAEKVKLTGRKLEQKTYYRHSGYPGGIKSITAGKLLASAHADRVVTHSIKGMLPKNSLGLQMLSKLKVYTGPDHPHAAQKPEELKFG